MGTLILTVTITLTLTVTLTLTFTLTLTPQGWCKFGDDETKVFEEIQVMVIVCGDGDDVW